MVSNTRPGLRTQVVRATERPKCILCKVGLCNTYVIWIKCRLRGILYAILSILSKQMGAWYLFERINYIYKIWGKRACNLRNASPPWRFICAQGVCPTNIGIDHLGFETTDADIGRLAYYPHIAPSVVVLVTFPPPEPIVRVKSGSYVKIPPFPNDTPAFAYGVMQAIIQGGAEGRDGKGPIYSTFYEKPPFETCIINYTVLWHPSGAQRKRNHINKERGGFGRRRAGDVRIKQKTL